jgi:carbon monoxide dehydrogenase subunit G
MTLSTGSASIVINRPIEVVWAAVTDITRMGEWSPECIAGRWTKGSTSPAEGAEFEGDNIAKVGRFTLKKWTTTSRVSVCEAPRKFAFVVEGMTTWTYALEPSGDGTKVTESFRYDQVGLQGFIYGKIVQRGRTMQKGMTATLGRIKAVLESSR